MAEVVDLEEWEVLSRNSSSCKEEFEEEEDFAYFDYFSNDLERGGEKLAEFDYGEVRYHVVGESSAENLMKSSRDFDSEVLVSSDKKGLGVVVTDPRSDKDCSDLEKGFDDKDANFVRDNDPTEEFVSSVTCDDEQDAIGELGFGEMEVLNEFYLNQVDDGTINYEKSCLKRENDLEGENEQLYSEKQLKSSVFPFQGIDNSDSVFSSGPNSEIFYWKSPKAILTEARKEKGGFFEMEMGSQNKIFDGNCSKEFNGINSGTNSTNDSFLNLSKDPEEQNIPFDENKAKSNEAEIGTTNVQDGSKGENALLAWWKVPIEVVKYCIFGVRPVWSISVAMGFLGFLMFSRSYYLYKMRQKDSKTRPALKVRFDEKVRSSFLLCLFCNFSCLTSSISHFSHLSCTSINSKVLNIIFRLGCNL